MNEAEVKNMMNDAMKEYDQDIALPRHNQNLDRFEELFAVLHRAEGAFKMLVWVAGLPAVITACIVVYRLIRTH